MGRSRFTAILRCSLLAAAALAAAFLTAIIFASPASAQEDGGVGEAEVRKWDTDNLKIGATLHRQEFRYTALQGQPAFERQDDSGDCGLRQWESFFQ